MSEAIKYLTRKAIFNLLSRREGDSFELGRYYFLSLSLDEKEELKKLLNETSIHYFYTIKEGEIKREETKI